MVCLSYVTIPSYEGNQPYIYVYYAEEDTRLALPVLVRLYNEGLRMWSWNGCPNPTEVRASQRISSCAALLIFLSDNLNRDIDRGYFEAMEALRCNKVKYFVRLSDVELPFDWGRSETNVVIDYARSNEAAFWLSVYDIDVIERCRGAWPSQPLKSGMSVFESIDSSELSDEYSNILKIIGESPTLDRSGVPINAEDIALFAGAGDPDEKQNAPSQSDIFAAHIDDLNRQSMEDLFGMLDEISVSTRRRAEEMQQAAEQRRQEQEEAALRKASLPFQHDAVKLTPSDKPLVPALRFVNNLPHWTETAAREMFGSDKVPFSPQDTVAPSVTEVETMARTMFGDEIVGEEMPEEKENLPEPSLPDIPVIIIEDEHKEDSTPSFEAFIDELSAEELSPVEILEESLEESLEETIEEEITEAPEEETVEEDPEPLPMPTQPKTVEIEEASPYTLLPPASGSLTGYTLPDDNYITTAYVENFEEGSSLSAAERAAAAEESRKQFESALEKAAYSVSGRIVARHSGGEPSVGLRVRKPKARKAAITAIVKPSVKVSPTLIQPAEPKTEKAEEIIAEEPISRAERGAERRNRRRARRTESTEAEIAENITETPKKVSVTPEPVRPAAPQPPIAEPAPVEVPAETAETAEETPSRRKKRHPHNSSGLIEVLRSLRAGSSQESESETEEPDSDEE